jgi:hypothetical protein
MIYDNARVSTGAQDQTNQLAALKATASTTLTGALNAPHGFTNFSVKRSLSPIA